jgi:hypothetical protein
VGGEEAIKERYGDSSIPQVSHCLRSASIEEIKLLIIATGLKVLAIIAEIEPANRTGVSTALANALIVLGCGVEVDAAVFRGHCHVFTIGAELAHGEGYFRVTCFIGGSKVRFIQHYEGSILLGLHAFGTTTQWTSKSHHDEIAVRMVSHAPQTDIEHGGLDQVSAVDIPHTQGAVIAYSGKLRFHGVHCNASNVSREVACRDGPSLQVRAVCCTDLEYFRAFGTNQQSSAVLRQTGTSNLFRCRSGIFFFNEKIILEK